MLEAKKRLETLENLDFEIEKLKREKKILEKKLEKLALEISDRRKKGAEKLKEYLAFSFSQLGMDSARFEIEFSKLEDFSPTGIDSVLFLFSGNPKLPLSPLDKSISGGEFSRFLLSVLSLIGENKRTTIFDEIDTGMSGKVLSMVAKKLKEISKRLQVVAVSHSPQVVAVADKVFKVEKEKTGIVNVKEICKDEIEKEIAIMISGKVTEGSLSAAKDLLRAWEE
ncbi:MAG: hypothetical protein ABGX27_03675 [Desulfurobacteriaceae bacterium]